MATIDTEDNDLNRTEYSPRSPESLIDPSETCPKRLINEKLLAIKEEMSESLSASPLCTQRFPPNDSEILSQIPNQEFYLKLDKTLENLPKLLYIDELILKCNNDCKLINWYRQTLADRAREFSDCPATRLVTRRTTAKRNSAYKSAEDCCILQCFINGERTGEISQVFSGTLLRFLEQEMGVYRIIDFHRVHRIGAFDKDTADTYPRPIIASFEKFKDREFIRSLARETLRGRRYGIREQFPRVIEQKRKMLYPVAKEARQNKENKVRLVRDRLFINNKEVNVETEGASEWQRPRNAKKTPRTPWQNPTDDKSSRRGDRVFYRGRGTKTQHRQRTSYAKKLVDFNIPLSNPFSPLAGYNDESRQDSKSISRKHPATSPLDDAHILKKHRDDSNPDTNSEMMIDQTETRMSPRKSSSENSANDASYSSYKLFKLKPPSLDQSSLEEMQSTARQADDNNATPFVRSGTTLHEPTNVVAMTPCVNQDNINTSNQNFCINDHPHAVNVTPSGRPGPTLPEPPDTVTMTARVTCDDTDESISDTNPNVYPHGANVTSPGRPGTTLSEPPDAVAMTSSITCDNINESDQDPNLNDYPHVVIVTPSGRPNTTLNELPDDTMVTSCADFDEAKDGMSNSGTFDAAGVNECASGEQVTKSF